MNILFTTRRFPPSIGGMERYAFDIYTALTKQPNTNITLVKWGGHNKWLHVALLPYFFVRGFWILLTQKIDVIHMQDGVLAPIGYALKLIFRKPLVVVIHGLDVTYQNPLFKVVVPFALRRADRIICISSAAREEVLKRGVAKERAVIITLGVDDALFTNDKKTARARILTELSLPQDAKLILSVGRLVKRKGIAWFIQNVMPSIVGQNPNAYLLISGEGEARTDIEAAIVATKLEKSVLLLGRTSDQMRQDLYNGSDVFVMPNVHVAGDMEGFGMVLTESAICELPVVAAGIEGIRDAVKDGQNGYLLDSKDAAGFAGKVSEILADSKAAVLFGQKARTYTIQHYNWDAIAGAFLQVYKSII